MLEQIRPMDIERRSFEIITELLGDRKLDPENELVIKRAIHTTADFDYADNLVFSDHAVTKGIEALRAGCGPMLEDIRMFDVFRGAQIGLGNKSVAFSLTFRAADHTLTVEEITRLTDKALKISKEKFGALLRA